MTHELSASMQTKERRCEEQKPVVGITVEGKVTMK